MVLTEERGVGTGAGGRADDALDILLRVAGEQRRYHNWKHQAVNFYHEQWTCLSLPVGHFRVRAVRQGIERARVEAGKEAKMVKEMEGCAGE